MTPRISPAHSANKPNEQAIKRIVSEHVTNDLMRKVVENEALTVTVNR